MNKQSQQASTEHILKSKAITSLKFNILMMKLEKTKGLCDLLKTKIDEIETIKFH